MAEKVTMGQQRVAGVDPQNVPEDIERVFDTQRKKWGAPLVNHRVYARCPEIFHGAQGMWGGLKRSGHLESTLTALVNRRVAWLNSCFF